MGNGRRVLLVRPLMQAERSAAILLKRDFTPVIAPILTIVDTGEPVPAGPFDALVVTSTNAVSRLAALGPDARQLPVFAVGRRTAEALDESGWPVAIAGTGSAADLATAIAAQLPPGSRLLHLTGRDRTGEPGRSLGAAGMTAIEWESYAAEPAAALPNMVADELAAGTLFAALHYSRRSAKLLLSLVQDAGETDGFARLSHLCLSAEVAAALSGLEGARVVVAAEPSEPALLCLLETLAADPSAGRGSSPPHSEC